MANDVTGPNGLRPYYFLPPGASLRSYYFLPTRVSLKRPRCYLADDADKLITELRDCIKAAGNAGLKAIDERNAAEKNVRDLQRQLDECQASPKELSPRKTGWHAYRGCGDAPKVKEYQKEAYLCMVQRYAKDTGEEVGAVNYQVLLCDDNGLFWGLESDSLVDYKVIAWSDIPDRDYENAALAYQRQEL